MTLTIAFNDALGESPLPLVRQGIPMRMDEFGQFLAVDQHHRSWASQIKDIGLCLGTEECCGDKPRLTSAVEPYGPPKLSGIFRSNIVAEETFALDDEDLPKPILSPKIHATIPCSTDALQLRSDAHGL